MPSVIFREAGSDATGDLSFWTDTSQSGSSTAISDPTIAHTGQRSIKLTTDGTNGASIDVRGVLADAGRRISCWVMFSSAASQQPIVLADASFNAIMAVQTTSGAVLQVVPVGGTTVNGTTVLSPYTFYQLVVSYTITSPSVWTFNLYLNGSLEVTVSSNGTLSATSSNILAFGCAHSAGAGVSMWLDDVCVDNGSDLSWPGFICVTAKRPFANGTANNFTTQIGSGGSGYGSGHAPQENEIPLNTADGWSIAASGSPVTEEYNVEGASVGDVNLANQTIVDVAGWVYAASTANASPKINVDGTQTTIATTSTPTLFTQDSATPTHLPAGTGTDVGLVTDTTSTTFSLYEAGILVSFIRNTSAVASHLKPVPLTYRPRAFAPGLAR